MGSHLFLVFESEWLIIYKIEIILYIKYVYRDIGISSEQQNKNIFLNIPIPS